MDSAPHILQPELDSLEKQLSPELPIRERLTIAQLIGRVKKIIASGASFTNQNDALDLLHLEEGAWDGEVDFNVSDAAAEGIARRFIHPDRMETGVVLRPSSQARCVAEKVAKILEADGVDYGLMFYEPVFDNELYKRTDKEGFRAIGVQQEAFWSQYGMTVSLLHEEVIDDPVDEERQLLVKNLVEKYRKGRSMSGELDYILTLVPTRKDAELDGMDYPEYCELFAESCDQPWEAIQAAQEILINEYFDPAKKLTIKTELGTNLKMSLEDMTFANSVVRKNVPGSEIFSAPAAGTIDGTIISKGTFARDGLIMRDLRLVFRDGELVEAEAQEGNEFLQEIISVEGGNKPGEIAFGTNCHLRRHMTNTLLVEKTRESFHVALGACYSYTEYDGKPVNLDNGNRSTLHWDITTMLNQGSSVVTLDGKPVQENGRWLDPRLTVLNEGWGAMPIAEQPSWWKEKFPNGYQD